MLFSIFVFGNSFFKNLLYKGSSYTCTDVYTHAYIHKISTAATGVAVTLLMCSIYVDNNIFHM